MSTATPWIPPYAEHVSGTVALPGSKSLTARWLVLAALADTPSTIRRPLVADDTVAMRRALESLGATISGPLAADARPGAWDVVPGPLRPVTVDCGMAGTVWRFLLPLAPMVPGVEFTGDAALLRRPIDALRDAVAQLSPGGVARGGEATLDASASSQFVTALLLTGWRYPEGVTLHVAGEPPSLDHLAMTVQCLRRVGLEVSWERHAAGHTFHVPAQSLSGFDVGVEPDLSSAAPFLAAAALRGSVRMPWPDDSTQPGARLEEILGAFGACTERREGHLLVARGDLHGIDLDAHAWGELVPVLATLAANARGSSRLSGIAHLRGHETDRLAAFETNLALLGAQAHVDGDALLVIPGRDPAPAPLWHAYGDHRLVMAGALAGLTVAGLRVDDTRAVSKTFPGFLPAWTHYIEGRDP